MKKNGIFLMLAYFLALPVGAKVIEDQVEAVERGVSGEDTLVKLRHGRVLWLPSYEKSLALDLESLANDKERIRFDYNEATGVIEGLATAKEDETVEDEEEEPEYLMADYDPSNLPNLATAQSYFNSMDSRTKSESQCYNRAHGWAYDLWRTRSLNSMKLFLFFTSKYIRAYRYHWWFHVTPMTYIGGVEHTLDRSFTRGPIQVKTWTNIFMKNDAQCRSVSYYSHYRRNQNAEWCYLIRASQYYRTPSDLELYERNGRTETKWITSELRQARRQAFIYWRNYDP